MQKKIEKTFDLTIKSTDGEKRTVSGYASTFGNIDLSNDIVVKGAFAKSILVKNPKMLYQHKTAEVVGVWNRVYEDEQGLYIEGTIANTTLGKDVLELISIGAIDKMSIGCDVVDYEYKDNARLLKELDLWEVSLVTFPANEKAKILSLKEAPQNVREFEQFLCDAGYSRNIAKAIISKGYRVAMRDVSQDDDLTKCVEKFSEIINNLIGKKHD
jgi:HK97 family phage prohead protease